VWRSPNKLAVAIRWLLIANAVVLGLSLLTALYARGVVDDFADDVATDEDFLAGLGLYLAASVIAGLLQLATGIVTIVWQYRLVQNTQQMSRPGLSWGPGWAIAGWLIPCVNFVVPYLQLRELWKASDWSYAAGDPSWKQAPVGPVLPMWVAAWIANSVIAGYAQLVSPRDTGDDLDAVADQFSAVVTAAMPGYLIAIAAALLFLIVVQQLTERHNHAVLLAAAGRLGDVEL
jgi:hypothetical protein